MTKLMLVYTCMQSSKCNTDFSIQPVPDSSVGKGTCLLVGSRYKNW